MNEAIFNVYFDVGQGATTEKLSQRYLCSHSVQAGSQFDHGHSLASFQ